MELAGADGAGARKSLEGLQQRLDPARQDHDGVVEDDQVTTPDAACSQGRPGRKGPGAGIDEGKTCALGQILDSGTGPADQNDLTGDTTEMLT